MKKILLVSCMLFVSYSTFSQQIKEKDIELDEIIKLLSAAGYELFSYDISDMLHERYDIEFIKMEYKQGQDVLTSSLSTFPNKRLLSDFPESSRQKFIDDDGQFVDSASQAIAHAETISLGFFPADNDSTQFMHINLSNMGSMRMPLKMQSLSLPGSDRIFFSYYSRPFKLKAFTENEFIPLVLFGSSWYDAKSKIFRFCGENEIDPDMSSEILQHLPHYYVIGLKFINTSQHE